MDADPRDPFWQQQIDEHVASRGQHADPSACGTCRGLVASGKPVEHDECAQRALLVQPLDMPSWEVLSEMTEQEKRDLPARYHLPVFDDCGKPNAWLCTVCWGEGWVSGWPCQTAVKQGTRVFSPERQINATLDELRIQLRIAERRNADLADQLAERTRQLNGLLDSLSFDEKAVPA